MSRIIHPSAIAVTIAVTTAIVGSLSSGQASAAGFALTENSASGMGNAFAGASATASDASTVYFNPAGMTHLKQRQISGALHLIRTRAQYVDQGSTAAGGALLSGSNENIQADALVPNFYYVVPMEDRWTFGLGVNVPFGLKTDYEDDWVGRYHAVKSQIESININPSFAYQVDEKLSLGFGLSAQYVDVTLTNVVDFGSICEDLEGSTIPAGTCASLGASPQGNDGFADLQADSLSWGYNFGLLYDITPRSRAGIAYRSRVAHTLEGDADFTVPGNLAFLTGSGNFIDTDLSSNADLPESFSFSLYHEYSEKLAVMFDWTLTRWRRFDELRIDYDSVQPDSVTTEKWNDSDRYSLGFNYQYSETLMLRGGVALDETSIPDRTHRTPRIPGNDRRWVSVGFGYKINEALSVDVGYSHLFLNDTKINHTYESGVSTINHTLKGKYESSVDIFSTQLNMKF
ncbi:MAG: hypothetical protein GXP10_11560 [Gammaproteobacteria bacterium]|nr:hypothetical protein [Gammaproteobacteria bacterium]